MIGLALRVAVVEDSAVVLGVVFPAFHLLNAPWQKTGEKSVTGEADLWDISFNRLMFFSLALVL